MSAAWWWIIALAVLWAAIYTIAPRYVRWVSRRLTRNPPMPPSVGRLPSWKQAAEDHAKALMDMAADGDRPHCGDCTVTWDSRGDRSGLIPCNAHKPPGFTRADWDAIASWGDHAEEEK